MGTSSSVFGIIQKQTGILWNGVFFLQKKACNITFSQHYELQKLHVTTLLAESLRSFLDKSQEKLVYPL